MRCSVALLQTQDIRVHSGGTIRRLFKEDNGVLKDGGEASWVTHYYSAAGVE